MPRRKVTHSRTDVRAQWKLLVDMGAEPVSITFFPDGSFEITTAKGARIEAAEPEYNEWDEVLK